MTVDTGTDGIAFVVPAEWLDGASAAFFRLGSRLDSDGDGIPDWWAERYGGSPGGLDPDSDLDRDGFSAREEYTALTDPTDAGSLFEITLATGGEGANGGCRLVWDSAPGRLYRIHAAGSLTGAWADPPIATLEGTGLPLEYPLPAGSGPLFLRVNVSLSGE